jgi:hypothetical protein
MRISIGHCFSLRKTSAASDPGVRGQRAKAAALAPARALHAVSSTPYRSTGWFLSSGPTRGGPIMAGMPTGPPRPSIGRPPRWYPPRPPPLWDTTGVWSVGSPAPGAARRDASTCARAAQLCAPGESPAVAARVEAAVRRPARVVHAAAARARSFRCGPSRPAGQATALVFPQPPVPASAVIPVPPLLPLAAPTTCVPAHLQRFDSRNRTWSTITA